MNKGKFTTQEIITKFEVDPYLIRFPREDFEKFIVRYFNDHLRYAIGILPIRAWVNNPRTRFKFTYADFPGAEPTAATGKSGVFTEVIYEDSDKHSVLNRVTQVWTVEVLHALLRYMGAEELESKVEPVLERSKRYITVHISTLKSYQGLDLASIYDSEGIRGYKFEGV